MTPRVAIFASGGGTNLQALIDHFRERPSAEIALVVSDRAEAGALDRAERAGIPKRHIALRGREPAAASEELSGALDAEGIDLIGLAGYLQLVPTAVVRAYSGRILNIHPALLPAFGGKGMYGDRVHRAVLDVGCRVSGATVHFVNERYDEGRILAQWPVPVLPGDTPPSLAERVLGVEHVLYPAAMEWLARAVAEGAPSRAERTLPRPSADPGTRFTLEADGTPDRDAIRRLFGLD